MGALMLVAPHQFSWPAFAWLQGQLTLWGVGFLAAGLGLLAVVSLAPGFGAVVLIHLWAGSLLLALAAGPIRTGGWSGALGYLVLGFGTAVAPLVARLGFRHPGLHGEAFSVLIGFGALVSGVGMHMTKHVYGLYSTEPGRVAPPEQERVQAAVDAEGKRAIRDVYDGAATVAAYSVVHGRDGEPEWGVVICDVPEGDRAYGKVLDTDMLGSIERDELVGRKVTLTPTQAETAAGKQQINVATM